MPFGIETLTFKVAGKIFIFIALDEQPTTLSLKNTPEKIAYYKETYSCVAHGPYLNKQHWMYITTEQEIDLPEIKELIKESYQLVYSKLPKKTRTDLEGEG